VKYKGIKTKLEVFLRNSKSSVQTENKQGELNSISNNSDNKTEADTSVVVNQNNFANSVDEETSEITDEEISEISDEERSESADEENQHKITFSDLVQIPVSVNWMD